MKTIYEAFAQRGKSEEDRQDLVELLRHGPVGHNYVPEQERNFDAGFTPSEIPRKFIREERIDGTLYRVYQG